MKTGKNYRGFVQPAGSFVSPVGEREAAVFLLWRDLNNTNPSLADGSAKTEARLDGYGK